MRSKDAPEAGARRPIQAHDPPELVVEGVQGRGYSVREAHLFEKFNGNWGIYEVIEFP